MRTDQAERLILALEKRNDIMEGILNELKNQNKELSKIEDRLDHIYGGMR